jgi:ERCC4-type nuclease
MARIREDARKEKGKSYTMEAGKSYRVEMRGIVDTGEMEIVKFEEIPTEKLELVDKLMKASIGRNIFIYDKREERSGRPQQVINAMKAWGEEMKVVPVVLPIGDYIINGACIEYKTAEDFIQSKISGHLDVQLFNMSARYPNSYLVVEGNVQAQAGGRVHYNAILSSLIGASFRRSSHGFHGMINKIDIETQDDFPYVIKFMMKKEHIRYPPPLKVPVNKKEMVVATLSTIPSIRTVRARALIEHFGSLRAVFNATQDELESVSGVGSGTAEKLLEYVTRKIKKSGEHIL